MVGQLLLERKRRGEPLAKQVYLFYGDEDLLIQEKINGLKKSLADSTLNIEQIDGEKPDLERIISALQTQSLLLGNKFIIIKNIDLKLSIWDEVMPALKTIALGTTVVFWAQKAGKRSKLYKLIDEIGEVYEFKSFAPWEQDQVVSWIMRRSKELGKGMGRDAAMALQEICGSGLRKLSSEVEKLVTYVGDQPQITAKDVEALASPGQLSVFVLSDAIADKDLKKALSAFRILQRNKIELFPILSLLANRYRIMLVGKSVRDPARIAQTLKASPFYVKKCLAKAGKFNQGELKKNLELILETDLKLKSGESQVTTFELLLTSLCGG